MRIDQKQLCAATSTAANFTSIGIDLQSAALASIHAIYTGTPSGTISIQVSNDPVVAVINGADPAGNVTNWSALASPTQVVSAAGSAMLNLADVGYRWVRLQWVGSGTGTLTANLIAKGV